MPSPDEQRPRSPSLTQGQLESPFLEGEIFVTEVERDLESRLKAVEAESPFLQAFEQGRAILIEPEEPKGEEEQAAGDGFPVAEAEPYEEEARADLEDSLADGYDEDEAEYMEGETGEEKALTRMKFEFQTENRIFRNDGMTSSLLGRKYGRNDFLVKEKGVRLESETDGVLEFETEWFRTWPKLEKAIEKALEMIRDIEKAGPSKFDTTRKAFPFKVDHLRTRLTANEKRTGVFDRLPGTETKNEKILGAKEELEIEIVGPDGPKWKAAIQSSESFLLEYYESFLRQHELLSLVDDTIKHAQKVLDAVNTGGIPAAELAKLRSFLQIIVNYVMRGRSVDTKGHPAKATFQLMSRTNFASIYRELLTQKEKKLLEKIVTTDAILKELGLDRTIRFFKNGYGSDPADQHTGPTVYEWLSKIPRGVDLLSAAQGGSRLSAAMGRYRVDTKKGEKDRWHVKFETRGTRMGRVREAKDWVKYASDLFDLASKRERDAVSLAFQQGVTDEIKLTNFVFHARHPDLQYRRIRKGEYDLGQEWNWIRDNLVRPVVAGVQPELEVLEGPFYSDMEEYASAHEAEDADREDLEATTAHEDLFSEEIVAPQGESEVVGDEANEDIVSP